MNKKTLYIGLVAVFILFNISHFTKADTNYDFWIVLFLFWIAQGIYTNK